MRAKLEYRSEAEMLELYVAAMAAEHGASRDLSLTLANNRFPMFGERLLNECELRGIRLDDGNLHEYLSNLPYSPDEDPMQSLFYQSDVESLLKWAAESGRGVPTLPPELIAERQKARYAAWKSEHPTQVEHA